MARHYTKREKVTAAIAAEMTTNVAVERATGIPESSIRRWRDDPQLAIYVDKTRDMLAEDMQALAAMAVDTIRLHIQAGKFESRDLVTLLGVATEKSLLLSGNATSRTETRDLTGTIADADIADYIREAEDLIGTGAGRTPTPAEDPPEG